MENFLGILKLHKRSSKLPESYSYFAPNVFIETIKSWNGMIVVLIKASKTTKIDSGLFSSA